MRPRARGVALSNMEANKGGSARRKDLPLAAMQAQPAKQCPTYQQEQQEEAEVVVVEVGLEVKVV